MKKLKSHKCFGGEVGFWQHSSVVTQTPMNFSSFIPPNPQGALIWLSGLTCNEENFITKSGVQRYLSQHGLAIFCPDTSPRGLNLPQEYESQDFGSGAGFYVDAQVKHYREHYKMYTYISQEFYDLVESDFGFKNKISIMGHSMGGHGALVIGLRNADKFNSISALAPIANPSKTHGKGKALERYLGSDESLWKSYDTCELLDAGFTHRNPILIDQGLADELLPERLLTPKIEEACKGVGQACEVRYRKDYDHSYYYVSTFIHEHIEFHHRYLS